MQTLGRALRKIGEDRGAGGRPSRVIFSTRPRRRVGLVAVSRFVRRLAAQPIPPRAGLYAAGAFLGAWLAYGAALGGHLPAIGGGFSDAAGYVAARAGFGIEHVHISGHRETDEGEVLRALDLGPASSLLTLDPYAARARLSRIPWVESATVQKLFPDSLKVEIVEHEPFALWQIGGMVSIIDSQGGSIASLKSGRHAGLPLVAGYGANRAAPELMGMLEPFPRIAVRLRAAVRVAERRWNLRLDNGIELRLPQDHPAAALAEIDRLDTEHQLLSRDITVVDMRLDDRIVVRRAERDAEDQEARAPTGRPGA